MRQDNLPDYGLPGAAWEEPLAPTSVLTPAPVDQSNFYGSANYDADKASQDSYTARLEHDVNRRLTLRNQTRYNQAHREALITDDPERRGVQPGHQPRHAGAPGQRPREQDLLEPDRHRRSLRDRPAEPCGEHGRGVHLREAVCADAHRRRHQSPGRHLQSRSRSVSHRVRAGSHARVQQRLDGHGRAVRVRHGGSQREMATDRRRTVGALRDQLRSRRCCRADYDEPRGVRWRDEREGGPPLPDCAGGQRLRLVRNDDDAARHRELHAERAGEQPEQPERRASGVHQLRGRQQVGLRRTAASP